MGSTVQSFCSTIGVCIAMLHVLVCGTSLIADDAIPVSDPDGIRYFETHVRPLLAERCYKCHGSKKQESSLRLDSFVGLMKGGDAGESIVPGKPTQSLLITALKYQDPNLQMPPNGKLTDRDIAKLSRWIEIGAPHPDATVGPVDSKKRINWLIL
ncbi:MAG: hypothetical protein O3A00_25910, partial [Planctomycetota bacterium]|nr:hypothetical protein [Planctomycetota bacterium]